LKLFDFLYAVTTVGEVPRLIRLFMAKPDHLVHSARSRPEALNLAARFPVQWPEFATGSKDRASLNHKQVNLLEGMDDNYAWIGKRWPDSHYIVLTLSFDSQGEDKPLPWINGWRCVFDTKPGNSRFPPISPTTTPRRSSYPTGAADKHSQIGPLRA
jgi:hypothetical protein